MEKDLFYVTTPIYYVNDKPHIGHAYATIIADVLARYHRQRDSRVIFLTGTDENSQKTVDAAAKCGEEIVEYTNRLAHQWKQTWQTLGISHTDFIRTREARHIETVRAFWERVEKTGDIYKGKYEGLYCAGCEEFKKPADLVEGLCPFHNRLPEHIIEENYFFRLSRYQKQLLDFYKTNPRFVIPSQRFSEIISFVENGLEDISISRHGKSWGIPVPGDPEHVVYVWFDALINYVSGVGIDQWKMHPADIQMVGKDILRFHGVIWPAMLLSAGLPIPKQIIATGFFTIDGQKISKSLGNSIDPLELAQEFGRDALRYFLLREVALGDDGDFSFEKFRTRYNSDLANGLGNFSARVLALATRLGSLPRVHLRDEAKTLIESVENRIATAIVEARMHDALSSIWELISFGDRLVNEKKPWEDKSGDREVVAELVLFLAEIARLLVPFLPDAAEKISQAIEIGDDRIEVKKGEALFPRVN